MLSCHPAGHSHEHSLLAEDKNDFSAAVVQLTMETDEGIIIVGTGSFIERNVLVTARHVVFAGDNETPLPLAAKGKQLDLVAEHKDLDLAFLERRWYGKHSVGISQYNHCSFSLNPAFPPSHNRHSVLKDKTVAVNPYCEANSSIMTSAWKVLTLL